jgi:hypothetical protein
MVGEFINKPDRRTKRVIPALGEFLPLITLPMRYGWKDLKVGMLYVLLCSFVHFVLQDAYLSEVYDRNARWIIQEYPHLSIREPHSVVDKNRPEESFDACKVSLKLTLFHLYFAEHIARYGTQIVMSVCVCVHGC